MRKTNFFKIVVFLGDVFIMYAALFLALAARHRNLTPQFDNFLYVFFALYIFWLVLIFILNLYDLRFFKKPIDFFLSLIIFSILAFSAGVVYFYFRPTPDITPKTILILNVLIFDVLFVCWRYMFNLLLEASVAKEKAVIIGFHENIKEILPQVKKNYELVAFFCPPYLDGQKKCSIFSPGLDIVSEMAELRSIVAEKKVTSVVFALDFHSNQELVKEIFTVLPLTINYVGMDDLYESITKKVSLEYLDEVWFLEKISKPEDIFEQSAKRIFDFIFSVTGLALFMIFLPFAALAIKIEDHGPVFYAQKRVGKNGKTFILYKFRTMKESPNQDSKVWREKNYESVTRVGSVLRRLHLDELPQSYNIFRGDISFVGPRAEWLELAKVFEKEIPFYKQRYLVKPGLFGWAQINFPASKSVDEAKEKFEYDLYYIKNHSLLLDTEIILKAIKLFFL